MMLSLKNLTANPADPFHGVQDTAGGELLLLDEILTTSLEHRRQLQRRLSDILPVYEVASAVGYNDERYFIQRFKTHTGTTPGSPT